MEHLRLAGRPRRTATSSRRVAAGAAPAGACGTRPARACSTGRCRPRRDGRASASRAPRPGALGHHLAPGAHLEEVEVGHRLPRRSAHERLHEPVRAHVAPAAEADGGRGEALARIGQEALRVEHLEDARQDEVAAQDLVQLGGAALAALGAEGRHRDRQRLEVRRADLDVGALRLRGGQRRYERDRRARARFEVMSLHLAPMGRVGWGSGAVQYAEPFLAVALRSSAAAAGAGGPDRRAPARRRRRCCRSASRRRSARRGPPGPGRGPPSPEGACDRARRGWRARRRVAQGALDEREVLVALARLAGVAVGISVRIAVDRPRERLVALDAREHGGEHVRPPALAGRGAARPGAAPGRASSSWSPERTARRGAGGGAARAGRSLRRGGRRRALVLAREQLLGPLLAEAHQLRHDRLLRQVELRGGRW